MKDEDSSSILNAIMLNMAIKDLQPLVIQILANVVQRSRGHV
jgi:hypothetical protein